MLKIGDYFINLDNICYVEFDDIGLTISFYFVNSDNNFYICYAPDDELSYFDDKRYCLKCLVKNCLNDCEV